MKLVAVLLLLVCKSHAVYAEPSLDFTEVADGIFMFQGEMKDVFESEHGRVSNSVFILGKEAVAVVDTGASLTQGELIRQAIREHTDLPIKYVINTHAHLDHIFGNQAFIVDGAEFIAHHNYQQELANKGRYYQARLQEVGLKVPTIVAASHLVADVEVIDLGDRDLRLTATRLAHSNSDLMVYDINTATLIAGDLVFVDHCPVIDGSLAGWLDALADLEKIKFALLIPGHGRWQKDKSALVKMTRYLHKLQAAVREAIAEQLDLNTASQTLLADEARHWRLFDEFHQRNVIKAYTELEWE